VERVPINRQDPQGRLINQAVTILQNGGLICYPTDTIYGIGCDIFNKKAIESIYRLKGKGYKAPLSFICPSLRGIAQYAYISNKAFKLMRRLLPGPFTFVLPATRIVPKILMHKRKTVGIRVPDDNICQMLLELFGKPIVSTSASLPNGEITPSPDEILQHYLNTQIGLFLDCGPLGLSPSTVIDFTGEEPVILREGKGIEQILI
jgi:tRNA threonylcarbamoyl adenosine modification protein (Sua5/YciO/YrdC/YwlC family)